nr:hypothetical protein [uncultured Carboxylicivirga sp.]
MTEEYKYRPPLKYFLVGLGGITMSVIFGMVIGAEEIWFSIIMGLFCLMTLAMGIVFLTIFFRKFNVGNLKIGNDFIEIPGRWKDRRRVDFNDILDIGEFETYDNIIEIESRQGIHLIERNWMKRKEFDVVKKRLQEYWMKK